MRLNVGCGDNLLPGFINVDKFDKAADILCAIQDLDFDAESVDEIVVYQTLEHTPWHELGDILSNCYRMLKFGGTMVIEVPDIEVVARGILEDGLTQKWQDNIYGGYHRPWDTGRYTDAIFHQGSVHYQAFTWPKLLKALEDAGFTKVYRNSMEEKHPDYHYEENLSVKATK